MINFSFNLPTELPSSINTRMSDRKGNPMAKIKYSVKCRVNGIDKNDDMKYKQVLIIREPAVHLRLGEQQQETSSVTTWCCVDQGTSAMWSSFEKNVFTP